MPEIELKLPTPHAKQQHILDNSRRFNHLRCGRRFGKTHLIKELTLPVLDGYPIGVFYPTYKDSTEVWNELKKLYRHLIKKKDESLNMMWLVTGGRIDFWAMENPDSGQGFKYKRVIIDEAAKATKFKKAWQETIRPTLTDYEGDAWIMSRPKPNTYFKELEDQHSGKGNWSFFHFTSYDNPHILKEEIDSAKDDLDPNTFDQEYMAEYVDPSAHYFLYTFDPDKHVGECLDIKELPIKLSFDFNLEPFACIAYQTPDKNTVNIIKEIRLNNSDIYQMCDHIKALYPNRSLQVTGDRSGYNRTGTVRGKTSYWHIIKKELKLGDYQIRLRGKNLDLLSSRILCNSALYNKDIIIDENCVNLIKDCKYAVVDERGELVKDRNKNQNDFLDCFHGDTRISTIIGTTPIKNLRIGNLVKTPRGFKRIIDHWISESEIYEYTLSNSQIIKCTKDHLFYTIDSGFLPIRTIFEECKSITMEGLITSTSDNHTFTHTKSPITARYYIGKNGLTITGKFLKATMFTIRTAILLTMILTIFKLNTILNIVVNTPPKGLRKIQNFIKSGKRRESKLQKNGIHPKKERNGIENISIKSLVSISKKLNRHVLNVDKFMFISPLVRMANSARINVNQLIGESRELTTLKPIAVSVENLIQRISILNQKHAPEPVQIVSEKKIGMSKVYDITIEDDFSFYANGLVAHNCFRYCLDCEFPTLHLV